MNYLALDIGNVLCHLRQEYFTAEMSTMLNTSDAFAERFLSRVWELHDIGFTNIKDEMIDTFGIKSEKIIDQLMVSWNDVIIPNERIISFIKDLRDEKDIQIAFLSNMGIEHVKLMEQQLHPIYHDAIKHFSCEVGARKPSKLFYQSFLWEHPEFKGCLYVDDIQTNLDAGAKMGFKPFHFSLREHDGDYGKLMELQEKFETV